MEKKWIHILLSCFLLSAAESGCLQPGGRPWFDQLTVFDDVPISECDGSTRTETFKPALESANLQSSCELSFSDITESLRVIQSLINTTVYVVQRRRGCVRRADGKNSGFDAWSVNGEDLVTFDPKSQTWTPQSPSAETLKKKWDKNRARNVAFSRFIREQCPDTMRRIKLRSVESKTDLVVFAKPLADPSLALLTCHVTSTDRSTGSLSLIGDGSSSAVRILVTKPLPGPEGSLILRLTAQISLRRHTGSYRCSVQTATHNISLLWDGKTLDGRALLQESKVSWEVLTIILGVLSVALTAFSVYRALKYLVTCVQQRRPRPPDPVLVEQFSRMLNVHSPDLQNVLVSFIQGSEPNRELQNNWIEWISLRDKRRNDPEYYGGHNV
ncbi:uncharacterized protein LOC115058636 isoform X2 [Echeneis naucrates]|uniref:uncharacterized protein LOC115058636 isoform X2 n=1 Tax=Echeneis naucrates TaxID=173247 RepID=UPI00111381DD|nr:uncharacterized protein LOC115058636 isoform X2 [Echeneis naucrates]